MRRRDFLHAAPALAFAQGAPRAQRPNVIILMSDDQGYGDFSCHGNPVLKTPAFDRLHAESVRMIQFHSAPMCTPTRGQLMSGQDALRNGATSVTAGRAVLRRGLPTVADAFRASGYRTAIFGKWHLGDAYPYRPMERGFETAKYHLGWGFSAAPEFDNDYFNGRYMDNGVSKRFEGYCTDFWFREAKDWIEERRAKNEPFFCYLPTNTPHGPAWVAPKYSEPYRQKGQPADFFGMIANLDENLAALEKYLKAAGLKDNTIFIFMTDNGGTAGVPVFNAGMRARKTQIYDGGHRVPCFVRWPNGGLKAPRDAKTPAQMQDLFPTLLELCGVAKPPQAKFDGRSLAGLLRGASALPEDRMMVVQYGQVPKKWDACVIWNQWRLVGGEELYDIDADPGQQTNLYSSKTAEASKMRAHYEKWWAGVEPGLREYQPLSIGASQENPVILTSSDWQDIYCDNVGHVSQGAGGPRGGVWNVLVEREGKYEIRLYRWPPHLDLALTAGREPQKMTAGVLPAGKAFPVARAELRIGEKSMSGKASGSFAEFHAPLKAGERLQMQAWFQDAQGADLCGAFYAHVRRV